MHLVSGEPEWIEIYNKSTSAINLKGLSVSDNSTKVKVIQNNFNLDANSYLVISKDSSILNLYDVGSQIIVSTFPALNNTGDAVVIKDSINVVLDSLEYLPGWGGSTGGRSLERISISESSTVQTNWGSSQSLNKATPGKVNSITPKNNDLKILSFKPEKEFAIIGEAINFQIEIKNAGLSAVNNFQILFYKDSNKDSIPQSNELISNLTGNSIQPNENASYLVSTNNFDNGVNQFIAKILFADDEDSTNNIAFTKISAAKINEERNDIVINEFMYAPTSPQPEWIELFNRSDKTINLKNYKIADENDTVVVIKNSTVLNPKEYFIITKDSSIKNYYDIKSKFIKASFPALNNSGDRIILIDSLNRTIDSLEYLFTWGGSGGKSLERKEADNSATDSLNWATSISQFKATPGKINSITQKDFDVLVSKITFAPSKPLFGDEVSISAIIKNIGKNNSSFNVFLYEDTNLDSIPDLNLENKSNINVGVNDSAEITFNYIIKNLQTKKRFFVTAVFTDDQDTTNNILSAEIQPGYSSSSIIINEVMYDPAAAEPEWIELVNNSGKDVNIKNWSVSDLLPSPTKNIIINEDAIIKPGEYFIIAKDTSIHFLSCKCNRKNIYRKFWNIGQYK